MKSIVWFSGCVLFALGKYDIAAAIWLALIAVPHTERPAK